MGLQFGVEDVIANSQGNCLAIRNTRCLKKPGRFISHLRLAFKVAGYNARLRVVDWPLEDPDTSPLLT